MLSRYSPGVRCALGCRHVAATPGLRPSASGSTSSAPSLELAPKLPRAIVEGRAGILRHLYVSALLYPTACWWLTGETLASWANLNWCLISLFSAAALFITVLRWINKPWCYDEFGLGAYRRISSLSSYFLPSPMISFGYREAAVSFVVEWGSDGFKGKPDRLASPADTSKSSGAGAVAAGSFIDGYGRACQDRMTDEGGGVAFLGCGQNGGGRGRETTPREYDRQGVELAEEERKRAEGLKDLMRLGIFLDNHEVQEDTVDVLSSAGYL